ncbi:MAG TPA: CRISPR-associated endonuclease Cas1 [Blastocatellia bacterium]|nr:CRISPR-associated endonuclease Cas1 [Blastocatellia bacterium]
MTTLYLTEQGATLRKESRRFLIEMGGITLSEIHEFKVDRVIVFGHVQLTTQALTYLLARGIDTAFLSMTGRLKGRLAPLASKNVYLRVRQHERARDPQFALALARAIVGAKIANCIALLARHQRNHPETDLSAEISRLARCPDEAARKQALGGLRGVEGQAAVTYFQALARMLRRGWNFPGRVRRPPTDPVNSLLSFGYTLLYNEAISALTATGFDPYVGFYHGINYGRCSLALDLMEEFRHVAIDRLVLNLLNLGILAGDDFTADEQGGIYLREEARKRFLREYERLMLAEFAQGRLGERISLRRAVHEQALRLERTVMRGAAYEPFRGWR